MALKTSSTPATPGEYLGFSRQGGVQRGASEPSVSEATSAKVEPTFAIRDALNPVEAVPAETSVLSDPVPRQQLAQAEGFLPREHIFQETVDATTRALPCNEKSISTKDKLKSRVRRLLLRKPVLTVLLGENAVEWVYPWIHPKARGNLPV